MQPLQECFRYIYSHKRNVILIQFLQRIQPAAIATFSLRGVDHLPCLIVFLFKTVAGFRKIERDRYDDPKTAQIVHHVEKFPVAQAIS